MGEEVKKLMMSYVKYPPRKVQSAVYTGPITITNYQKVQWLRGQLQKDGFNLQLPRAISIRLTAPMSSPGPLSLLT